MGKIDKGTLVTVTSDKDGEVFNENVGFTNGTTNPIKISLTTAGEHTLTVKVQRVTGSKTVAVTIAVTPADQYVTVYEMNASREAVKYVSRQIVDSEIKE